MKHLTSKTSTRLASPPGVRSDSVKFHSAVVWWTLGATMVGMGSYTLVEFLIDRPADWTEFLLHHFIHVAMIGLAIWIASVVLIRRLVIEPVNHLFLHLKRVAAGRLEYLDVEVHTNEMESVVTSINELVGRLRRAPEADAVSRALDQIRELRAALRGGLQGSEDEAVPIMKLVTKLEGSLLELIQQNNSVASPYNSNLNQPEPQTL